MHHTCQSARDRSELTRAGQQRTPTGWGSELARAGQATRAEDVHMRGPVRAAGLAGRLVTPVRGKCPPRPARQEARVAVTDLVRGGQDTSGLVDRPAGRGGPRRQRVRAMMTMTACRWWSYVLCAVVCDV